MRGLPPGCLNSCLVLGKVAYFTWAKSGQDFRQLSLESLVNIGVLGLPPVATVPRLGNQALPTGCQSRYLWKEGTP